MAEETFETFVQRERDRLQAQREALVKQQEELEDEIALVDRELAAVDAYEAANRSYSAQWWSPTDLARWRDEHVRYRGVYFAA
jgi:hypothetical protein